MKVSSSAWKSYVDRLSKIDHTAAEKVASWYRNHPDADINELVNITYYYCDHYGSAAAELACEMYEEMADASGKVIKAAEPAMTSTRREIYSAIQGALLRTQNPDAIGAIAGRKVKTVGLDTLINNSLRDGAEFAWIPSGDTCAFCIMLASNGWQRASKKALKNGHASHVHNNCDCTYAIRFDEKTEVEGYDPDYYKALYDNAEGKSWREKVNSMRRNQYVLNRDSINRQKRLAYAIREDSLEMYRKTKNTGAFSGFEELMTQKHVRGVMAEMGIDPKNAKYKINRDENMIGRNIFGHTSEDGKVVTLFPDAFTNREQLVKTIGHEQIHLKQVEENGIVKTQEDLIDREREARASEEGWWESYVKKTGFRQ